VADQIEHEREATRSARQRVARLQAAETLAVRANAPTPPLRPAPFRASLSMCRMPALSAPSRCCVIATCRFVAYAPIYTPCGCTRTGRLRLLAASLTIELSSTGGWVPSAGIPLPPPLFAARALCVCLCVHLPTAAFVPRRARQGCAPPPVRSPRDLHRGLGPRARAATDAGARVACRDAARMPVHLLPRRMVRARAPSTRNRTSRPLSCACHSPATQ
jgi:hypothetical protein